MMNKLARVACVLMAMVVGVAVWADDAALAQWRMAMATNGYVAVERKQKVPQDVQQIIWKCYREHIGNEGVQMSRPRLVSTNEYGAVYDLPFTAADGVRHNFGVVLAEGDARPYYLSAEGLAGCKVDDVALSVLSSGTVTNNVVSTVCRVLDRANAVVFRSLDGLDVNVPFNRFHLYVSDDMPMAEWRHPVRYLFIDENADSFAVAYGSEPLEVVVDGVNERFTCVGDCAAGSKASRSLLKGSGALIATSSGDGFPSVSGGNASGCYALLVSGGYNTANNHCRYWNEICFVYNVLRKRFCLPRANIKVLWAGGDPAKDLCRNGTCTSVSHPCRGYSFETSNLSDFDLDGNEDIDGAATLANVRTVLSAYSKSLKASDQLLIFFSDHGGVYGGGVNDKATVCLWGDELMDSELASLTREIKCPVMAALKTCYSGGMIREFVDSSASRMMATADRYDPSLAYPMMGDWTYYFFSALCGYYPAGTPTTISGLNPRDRGEVCNADQDGDGRVSFYEAHQFAYKMNPHVGDDIPQYGESTANLGKKLFMTKYADMPAVIAKEKVLTPTLSRAPGLLGYAPCTVTASCGTSGATIRYTLDGSAPSGKSTVYSGKITVTKDATVSVRAFKSGMVASDVVSAAYTVKKTAPGKALITSVSQGDNPTGIVVAWAKGEGASSYDVLRAENQSMSSSSTVASGLSSATLTYLDAGAIPGKTYYYVIRAVNKYGKTSSAVSQAARRKLSPPSGIKGTVTAGAVTSTVKLTWDAAWGATHYRVFRRLEDGQEIEVTDGWKTSRSVTDNVPMNGLYYRYPRYFIQSATSSSGGRASDRSAPYETRIDASLSSKEISFSRPTGSGLSQQIKRTIEAANLASAINGGLAGQDDYFKKPVAIQLAVGESVTKYCEIINVNYYGGETTYSTSDSISVAVVSGGSCISLSRANNGYDLTIAARSETMSAPAVVRVTLSSSTAKKTRDLHVYVSSSKIIKNLNLGDVPYCMASGDSVELDDLCGCGYVDGSSSDSLPSGVSVQWNIVGGCGAELDDGVLDVHNLNGVTNVVLQATVLTAYGEITSRKTIALLPKMPVMEVEIPATGGASTNYITRLPGVMEVRFPLNSWLDKIAIHLSEEKSIGSAMTYIIGSSGQKRLLFKDYYFWVSFAAARNSGRDREWRYTMTWEGGGMIFLIRQKAAPMANTPEITSVGIGRVAVGLNADGSQLHYATDGEEPSADSPVYSDGIVFADDTVFAVKAFGDWMRASDTVYADIAGADSQPDKVKISFNAVQSGLKTPAARTYKANEAFGTLPAFAETNGLFFKGWSLHEGSDKVVAPTDGVPSQNATLYAVWSPVPGNKPSWSALPWDFESAMTVTMKVYDDTSKRYLDPSVCIVGIADSDGICRGSSENGFGDTQSELNGKNGLYVFGVYSQIPNGQETGLRIRVWNRQIGYMSVVADKLDFSAGAELGSETSPVILHVKVPVYKALFSANGGSGSKTKLVAAGKTVGTLQKAMRKGYKLKGWYTKKSGGTKITAKTKVMNNVTYYAQWTANTYKIKFNKNGGKGTMKTLSATYGKSVKLTANAFKRTGYKFAGWAKTTKGKVAYKNKANVKNLTATNGKTVTIYAVWKKAKSSSVKAAAMAVVAKPVIKPATTVVSVPAWAAGTFYGGDEGSFTTITVSKTGKVSGKVLFADGKWTIVGKAVGQRLETVATDADGNSAEVVFVIAKTPDGRCRIESEDGLILAE